MKFVIAPDSFKNCMTAREAAEAIRAGLARVFPDADYVMVPMADGGEGTVQSLVDATGGTLRYADVLDPLQRPTRASYGMLGGSGADGSVADGSGESQTAVIEMAAASGIHFVDEHTKNPLVTTTYGIGELIRHALDDGARTIILGVGGSATNDGGAGMAEALGARFLDAGGNPIPRGGGFLDRLATIDVSGLDPRLSETRLLIASDVTNPLVGPTGASAVFGPQKGATPEMVRQLDANLSHYAAVIKAQLGIDVAHTPGAGGAGGLGAGLLAFTNSTMRSGVKIVAETVRLAERAVGADYCFTGEGGIDFQTQYGKTPMGVAEAVHAGNPDIRVVAFAGYVGDGIEVLHDLGIDAVFGIVPGAMALDRALADGPANLARTAENVGRLIRVALR
ncbi:glycerate kinase [Bifidobacterium avesanii]|uniref:Glycerate kinase n=1 Tax=Bifidobacterium avesanii TaxID=1798157 RepID=A0A7K3THQ0_9BIFI|nr:glycerate kinase [Bifidobacterium avesanii]KAB8292038.1 glycerate kinase [Bifidobacterium avesanii]NEG78601.1 glycerate kinase [Bifidobacterium avesanii]